MIDIERLEQVSEAVFAIEESSSCCSDAFVVYGRPGRETDLGGVRPRPKADLHNRWQEEEVFEVEF